MREELSASNARIEELLAQLEQRQQQPVEGKAATEAAAGAEQEARALVRAAAEAAQQAQQAVAADAAELAAELDKVGPVLRTATGTYWYANWYVTRWDAVGRMPGYRLQRLHPTYLSTSG